MWCRRIRVVPVGISKDVISGNGDEKRMGRRRVGVLQHSLDPPELVETRRAVELGDEP